MSIYKMGLGAATAAALVLTTANTAGAASAPKLPSQGQTVNAGAGDMTDVSAQRRYRRGGNGGAIAGAAIAGIVGSAIIAGAARNSYYDGGYYGGRGYYGNPYNSYNAYGGGYGPYYGGGYGGARTGVYGTPGSYRSPEKNPNR